MYSPVVADPVNMATRKALLKEVETAYVEACAGQKEMANITAQLRARAAERCQEAPGLCATKGELVELCAEFAEPYILPSVVRLAEGLDAAQARVNRQGRDLALLHSRAAPIERTLALLEMELRQLIEAEANSDVGLAPRCDVSCVSGTDIDRERMPDQSLAPAYLEDRLAAEDLLLAKVKEARAEHHQLQHCRWLREVKAVENAFSGSTAIPASRQTGEYRLPSTGVGMVDGTDARALFFTVLNEAVSRCSPGFSKALPSLIPKLDAHSASLAESIICGFAYLEQLARIGEGEAANVHGMSLPKTIVPMVTSPSLTPHLYPPMPSTTTAASATPKDQGFSMVSAPLSTADLASARILAEDIGVNGCDLWGLPQSYL